MDKMAKDEIAKLSYNYRKFLLNNKNIELVSLNPEYTLYAIKRHLNFPLEKYISEEKLRAFNETSENIKILAKIALEHKVNCSLASLIKNAIHKKKTIAIIDGSEELGINLNSMFINLDNVTLTRDFIEENIREAGAIRNAEKDRRET